MRNLIVRLGAYGDCLIITPVIRHLKSLGDEVYVLTSDVQGQEIFTHNPNIDKLIYHKKDTVPNDVLEDYFKATAEANECDSIIDLCESIEVNIALHPCDPRYKYPKHERFEICNKNFYEETFRLSNIKIYNELAYGKEKEFYKPEIFFTEEEEDFMVNEMKQHIGKFKIVWGLSGSARQKIYPTPYVSQIIEQINKENKDVVIFMVGDFVCQLLEAPFQSISNVIKRSGIWTMRQSILACKYADIVISPDTGLLHGSGCFDTPKIGLLSSNTVECITKHFTNDHSIEAKDIPCAPCFYLVKDAQTQTQLSDDQITPMCMAHGIDPSDVYKTIMEVKHHAKT